MNSKDADYQHAYVSATRLSKEQLGKLVVELLRELTSLSQELDEGQHNSEWAEVIERRLEELREGKVQALPGPEARIALRRKNRDERL